MTNEVTAREATTELAAAIATRAVGCAPTAVRRFTTGMRHHVFDLEFAERPPVVARMRQPSARAVMAGTICLSGLLRPRGVPLPAILAEDIRAELPWQLLERLPGTDLGAVITSLTDEQLERIAANVVQAQAITVKTGSAGRFGYATLV